MPPVAVEEPMVKDKEKEKEKEKVNAEVTELALFSHLALHPDGLTMAELEQHFEVTRPLLNQRLKTLIENGKVRKSDKNYLAI